MKVAERVILAGGGLDRQAHRRARADEIAGEPEAQVVPFWRGRPLLTGGGEIAGLAPQHGLLAAHGGVRVFLGSAAGIATFAQDVSGWAPTEGAVLPEPGPGFAAEDIFPGSLSDLPDDARLAELRGLIARMPPLDAEIAASGRGILEWHRTHGFCASCGNPSEVIDGGWRRQCPSCGRAHFPRTDPVVIMLVTRGNALLVGRSPGWPEGFYSLLAGFMEPGETVAGAVRREVAEETGVAVGEVRMLASQPWPFPASLMIGCAAEAISTDITLDPVELEDALWISREDLLAVFAGTHPRIGPPREGAIAHFLMKMWLADRMD